MWKLSANRSLLWHPVFHSSLLLLRAANQRHTIVFTQNPAGEQVKLSPLAALNTDESLLSDSLRSTCITIHGSSGLHFSSQWSAVALPITMATHFRAIGLFGSDLNDLCWASVCVVSEACARLMEQLDVVIRCAEKCQDVAYLMLENAKLLTMIEALESWGGEKIKTKESSSVSLKDQLMEAYLFPLLHFLFGSCGLMRVPFPNLYQLYSECFSKQYVKRSFALCDRTIGNDTKDERRPVDVVAPRSGAVVSVQQFVESGVLSQALWDETTAYPSRFLFREIQKALREHKDEVMSAGNGGAGGALKDRSDFGRALGSRGALKGKQSAGRFGSQTGTSSTASKSVGG